jgi:DNA uptake protein ComE-like DNA-binding protein
VIVKRYGSGSLLVFFLIGSLITLVLGLSGCSSRSRAQSQSEQDQQTREKVADATQKAKEESQKAAAQVQQAAQQTEHDAKVAAEGVKEGWNRDKQGRLDVNSATVTELRSLSLSETQAQSVINGRPYKDKQELVTRGILTQSDYNNIQDRITVEAPSRSVNP